MRSNLLGCLLAVVGLAMASPALAVGAGQSAVRAAASASLDEKFSTAFVQRHLTPGQTTVADVRALYGEPTRSRVNPSQQHLTYQRSQMGAKAKARRFSSGLRAVSNLAGIARVADAGAANAVAGTAAQTGSAMHSVEQLAGNEHQASALRVTFDQDGLLTDYSLD